MNSRRTLSARLLSFQLVTTFALTMFSSLTSAEPVCSDLFHAVDPAEVTALPILHLSNPTSGQVMILSDLVMSASKLTPDFLRQYLLLAPRSPLTQSWDLIKKEIPEYLSSGLVFNPPRTEMPLTLAILRQVLLKTKFESGIDQSRTIRRLQDSIENYLEDQHLKMDETSFGLLRAYFEALAIKAVYPDAKLL